MAGNIKGITIEFSADATKLDRSLKDIDKSTRAIDTELRKVDKGLKFNPTSVDLWRQKQTLLTQKITDTSNKLKLLRDRQKELDAKQVDKNSKEYRNLQREIVTTESKLKTFKSQLKQIGNARLKALGEQFKQIGSKMTAAGRTLTTYVTAPLVGVGAASLKAGADFDTAMSQVAATSGKTVGEIKDLRDFAKQMGSTTSFSATEAAEGLNYMALAGYSAKKSMKMLPTVLNLAAAGAMELGAASDMVTDAQTALGLSTKETTTLVDQMAKASSKSNTSVTQLGEAILKIGPTARNIKGGTKELTQVLGLLADNGIKGREAGTHLRNVLLSLNTTKVKDAFHELGVEVFDTEGNMRSLSDIFPELSKAMEGMTSEEKTGMLSKLFNKTDLAAINSLLGTSAERWDELGLAIDGAEGSAEQMAKTQLDNMKGSLTLLKSAIEGAGIAISDVLAPYVRMLADFVSDLVSKFNELDPDIQKVIVIIGALVAAIGPLLLIAGAISTAIGTLLPIIGGISAPVIAVGAAVAGLVAILATAYAKSEPFREAVNGIAVTLRDTLLSVIKSAVAFFKQLFAVIVQTATEVGTELAPVFQALMPVLKVVATFLAGRLKNSFNIILGVVKVVCAVIKSLATIFAATFKSVVTIATGAVARLKSIFSGVKNALVRPFEAAKNLIKSIIDKIKGFFNFKMKAPHVPLPHFAIKPSGWKLSDLLKGVKPSLSIDWYAKGGIFNSPTIAGIGEAGPEAVVPLDKFWDKLSELQGGMVINVYGSDGMSTSELADKVAQKLIQAQKRRSMAWR